MCTIVHLSLCIYIYMCLYTYDIVYIYIIYIYVCMYVFILFWSRRFVYVCTHTHTGVENKCVYIYRYIHIYILCTWPDCYHVGCALCFGPLIPYNADSLSGQPLWWTATKQFSDLTCNLYLVPEGNVQCCRILLYASWCYVWRRFFFQNGLRKENEPNIKTLTVYIYIYI